MYEDTAESVEVLLAELDRSTVFLCFIGDKYLPRVPDVSKMVATRPWIESLKDKSIVEIEIAAALVVDPGKFEGRAFLYLRDSSYLDSVPGMNISDYSESDPIDELGLQ
ncbi:hypothetical protein T484DRAFT_1818609, partial [Baffinella frigidus]